MKGYISQNYAVYVYLSNCFNVRALTMLAFVSPLKPICLFFFFGVYNGGSEHLLCL